MLRQLNEKRLTCGSLENHDQPRIVSRMASDHPDDRTKAAKLTAMFHCALGGTLFLYQGQEIGLCNVPRSWGEEEYKDIETIQFLEGEREHRRKTTGETDPDITEVIKGIRQTARDNGRTPIQVGTWRCLISFSDILQWESSKHAGFTKGTPWMRVHDDYAEGWNVASQVKDPESVWSFYQGLLKLRREYEALVYGELPSYH